LGIDYLTDEEAGIDAMAMTGARPWVDILALCAGMGGTAHCRLDPFGMDVTHARATFSYTGAGHTAMDRVVGIGAGSRAPTTAQAVFNNLTRGLSYATNLLPIQICPARGRQ